VKIQVEVFWVVMPYRVVAENQRFGGPGYLHLQGDFSMDLLPQHCTASQCRRPRLENIKLGLKDEISFLLSWVAQCDFSLELFTDTSAT